MKETIDDMVAKSNAKEAELQFNERMSALHEEFELSEADLKIVVEKIRGLNDEDYTKWYDEFSSLANDKKKSVIAERQAELDKKIEEEVAKKVEASKKEEKEEKKEESTASQEEIEKNLDDLEEKDKQAIANASDGNPTLDAWKTAFNGTVTIDGKKIEE
jgi:hypothetical protein